VEQETDTQIRQIGVIGSDARRETWGRIEEGTERGITDVCGVHAYKTIVSSAEAEDVNEWGREKRQVKRR